MREEEEEEGRTQDPTNSQKPDSDSSENSHLNSCQHIHISFTLTLEMYKCTAQVSINM